MTTIVHTSDHQKFCTHVIAFRRDTQTMGYQTPSLNFCLGRGWHVRLINCVGLGMWLCVLISTKLMAVVCTFSISLCIFSIDDDSWSEKADPSTGFVFHIDSPAKPTTTAPSPQQSSSHQVPSTVESGGCLTHHLTVSVSSSSLSSTQSVVESHSHTAPASPSSLVNTSLGFSER